jgi:DNA modification methylase
LETELTPVATGENFRIFGGDCREVLKQFPDNSIQCCVTSPPYWGLRDYGTADWEGGDPLCEHSISMPTKWNDPKRGTQVLRPEVANRGGDASTCHNCGAMRIDQQIGLEQSPDEFVAEMVSVFREVRRVLREDGTLWLNLGDSYAGNNSRASNGGRAGFGTPRETVTNRIAEGLKPKDLVGIPWRVALALQADGWFLRQDIIWHKPNPMPESVKDRCTKAHEYIFLLSKSSHYYFDADAIKEPSVYAGDNRGARKDSRRGTSMNQMNGATGDYKNKRSVWTVATRPYKGAHFAAFPPDLIEPCILAGSPKGGLVLDPFGGSGTTVAVSILNDREGVAIELNDDYIPLMEKRIGEAVVMRKQIHEQLALFETP